MSDLSQSALRTEIKTWERNFKARNAREPTVQDIRDQPAIAEKYKLYKKLSKAAAAAAVFSNLTQSNEAPSTPPRSNPPDSRTSLILSKKRNVEPAGPLSSFNPFSPQKNKGKQKDFIRSPFAEEGTRSNPFATPTKTIFKRVEKGDPSPDPFPVIQPFQAQAISSDFSQAPPAPTSALSRARKRLRGEPVSPSPAKEKRRRITSETSLPFSKLNAQSASSDESDSGVANSSFVDDSPIKRPIGSKSFQLLFDEAVPQAAMSTTKSSKTLSRSKTTSGSVGLFGEPSRKLLQNISSHLNDERQRDIGESGPPRKEHTKSIGGLLSRERSDQSSEFPPAPHGESSNNVGRRESAKRPLSDSETVPGEVTHGTVSITQLPLLPPSPPPVHQSHSRYKAKEMGQGKSRKKAKVFQEIDDEDDDEDSAEDNNVRLVERSRGTALQFTPDSDLDVLLFIPQRAGSLLPNGLGDAGNDASEFQVDLPEKLLHVLAISPPKVQDSKEERVVRGLLFGGRATNYDPLKGGEIWDVGEGEDDARADTDAEDDWEPEPVPWEVGEL